MRRHRATRVGILAILLWSALALLTVGARPVPPLQLNALCFGIGGGVGLVWASATGQLGTLRRIPLKVTVFGAAGLFGYHFLYFSALRLAPPAEAGLIAYLWPLLIVIFSGFLPGERLLPGHFVGALIGFIGAALILSGGFSASGDALLGYVLALICAFFWSGYSVLSRRLGDIPTISVTGFCLVSAVLSLVAHISLETTLWPETEAGWISVLFLGIGPVGLAFFVWDIGMKKGDIQLLGAASYAAPLLSTLILVGAGVAEPGWSLLAATLLVTLGALIAARASTKKKCR